MEGTAVAPAAGTVLNALATGRGSAFAIDRTLSAHVQLDPSRPSVEGTIAEDPDADTSLIEQCVSAVTERYGEGQGGTVRTESEIPLAAGLKSSSAAANATVLATLEALDQEDTIDRLEACRIGVQAARDAGVTVTGAFDDASASMLGGLTVTDNSEDTLIDQAAVEWDVLVWTPPKRVYSRDADVDRCRRIAPIAEVVESLARDGKYKRAMTINGLAYAAALEFPTEPMIEALPDIEGVSLSGTGPSIVAVGNREPLKDLKQTWEKRDGSTWLTTTQNTGARTK